jgi:hypothetical protein
MAPSSASSCDASEAALVRRRSARMMGLFAALHESAIGPKQTSAFAPHMSAIGGKADMTFNSANVRF